MKNKKEKYQFIGKGSDIIKEMKEKQENWEKVFDKLGGIIDPIIHECGCYSNRKTAEFIKKPVAKDFIRQEKAKDRQKLLKEIEKALQDFRIGVKRLEDLNSPIQILDTSKNFFIQKIKPLLETEKDEK